MTEPTEWTAPFPLQPGEVLPGVQAHTFTVPDTCDETWWWDGNTHVCGRKRGHVTDHKCKDCGKKWGGEQ